ncbi:MAG: sulfite exporter TauE/SafE family protein [Pseudomonadota bacterium]
MIQTDLLAAGSGVLVGFLLGLLGGGGSILAVPLLLYVVGVGDPHLAIGTSALAVALNAFANLIQHARVGNVKWPCAAVFASAGVLGAIAGSSLGKAVEGERLLVLFALVMVAVGVAMLRPRRSEGDPSVRINPKIAVRLAGIGFLTGAVSGFFGIGGGFLIVPGIMLGSGMPILNAIGSSLFSVGAFGLATAVNYALSGLVAWPIALAFIAGGVVGGFLGLKAAVRLSTEKQALNRIFAGVIFAVAAYMLWRSLPAVLVNLGA